MTERSKALLVDPPGVRVGRVEGHEFPDDKERVLVTWEHPDLEVAVALTPDAFSSFVVLIADALGLPQGDLDYLAERLLKAE